MRWQELFADLEAQSRALERSEHDSEVADRTRAEIGQVALLNRLRARVGDPVALTVTGAGEVRGTLRRVGADWLLVDCPEETIVPVAAVALVWELPLRSLTSDAAGGLAGRVSLTAVLRAVARDRSTVTVVLRDATTVVGTPDRVGSDFLDLAAHEAGAPPRAAQVRGRATVAFPAVALVRRQEARWA